MIYMMINRKCGHREQIGLAGFSGDFDNIPLQSQDACIMGIIEQEGKVCLPCFEKLPTEEKQKLLKEVTSE